MPGLHRSLILCTHSVRLHRATLCFPSSQAFGKPPSGPEFQIGPCDREETRAVRKSGLLGAMILRYHHEQPLALRSRSKRSLASLAGSSCSPLHNLSSVSSNACAWAIPSASPAAADTSAASSACPIPQSLRAHSGFCLLQDFE